MCAASHYFFGFSNLSRVHAPNFQGKKPLRARKKNSMGTSFCPTHASIISLISFWTRDLILSIYLFLALLFVDF